MTLLITSRKHACSFGTMPWNGATNTKHNPEIETGKQEPGNQQTGIRKVNKNSSMVKTHDPKPNQC